MSGISAVSACGEGGGDEDEAEEKVWLERDARVHPIGKRGSRRGPLTWWSLCARNSPPGAYTLMAWFGYGAKAWSTRRGSVNHGALQGFEDVSAVRLGCCHVVTGSPTRARARG